MKLAIALLTCDRYDHTRKTVQTLLHHNDLSDVALVYADDHSLDDRVRKFVEESGFEPVFLNNGPRMGCSPMTDALWHGAQKRVGNDGIIVSLQNDFISVRPCRGPPLRKR